MDQSSRISPRAGAAVCASTTSSSGRASGCGSPWSSAQKRSTAASATMPTAAARKARSPGGMRLPATAASARRRPMPRPPLPARPLPPRRAALLTVDVEDWFDVNYRSWVPPPAWDPPRRVVEATRQVLDLLAARGRRGTFFVLASAVRSAPGLVRAIAAAGHEVACHGLEHTLLYAADPARVERELREARRLLEDELGAPVLGFRAPSWSVTRDALWALDAIAAAGFRYDASLFPVRTYLYGLRESPLGPSWITTPAGAVLLEVPAPAVALPPPRAPHRGGLFLPPPPPCGPRPAPPPRPPPGSPARA